MTTKAFGYLLVGVLLLGFAVGGVFLTGMAVGKDQETERLPIAVAAPQPPNSGQVASAGNADDQTRAQLRERLQSGEVTQEELAQLRGQFGQGAGWPGGAGLTGPIQMLEGNTLTVNTPQGPLQAFITDGTIIQKTIEVAIGELTEGTLIRVTGVRAEDGSVEARVIVLIPEGQEGRPGGGFGGGFRGGAGGGGFGAGGFGGGQQ